MNQPATPACAAKVGLGSGLLGHMHVIVSPVWWLQTTHHPDMLSRQCVMILLLLVLAAHSAHCLCRVTRACPQLLLHVAGPASCCRPCWAWRTCALRSGHPGGQARWQHATRMQQMLKAGHWKVRGSPARRLCCAVLCWVKLLVQCVRAGVRAEHGNRTILCRSHGDTSAVCLPILFSVEGTAQR